MLSPLLAAVMSFIVLQRLQINTELQKHHLLGKHKSLFSILPVTPEALELTDHWRLGVLTLPLYSSLRICHHLLFEISH